MQPLAFKVIKKEDTAIHIQENKRPYQYDRLHYHPEYQISWIVKGKGVCMAGESYAPFSPGDLFVLPPNLPHIFKNDPEYFQEPKVGRSHMVSVFFLESSFGEPFFLLPEMKQIRQFFQSAAGGLKLPSSFAQKVKPFFEALAMSVGVARIIQLLSLLRQMALNAEWERLSEGRHSVVSKQENSSPMNKVLLYISRNFDKRISLEEAAGVANLSKYAFCRYFRRLTHKSFVTYLNEFRISMACKFLTSESYSVSQIGFLAGFNNLSNFYRQFKKVMKCTPAKYRKKYLNTIQ